MAYSIKIEGVEEVRIAIDKFGKEIKVNWDNFSFKIFYDKNLINYSFFKNFIKT